MKYLNDNQIERIKENEKVILLNNEMTDDYKINVCCSKDSNHIWNPWLYNIMNGSGCPFCKKQKFTTDDYNQKLIDANINCKIIGNYIKQTSKVKFQCLVNTDHIFDAIPRHVLTGDKQCPYCLLEKREEFKNDYLDKLKDEAFESGYEIIGEFTTVKSKIKCRCLKDETHVFDKNIGDIHRKTICPICYKTIDIHMLNHNKPVWETNPEIAKYLVNEEDGYKYSLGSNSIVEVFCPTCHEKFSEKLSDIKRVGFICPMCKKGSSYPNRFMYQVLKQLSIDFDYEYSCEWSDGKRYDFHFYKNNKEYFIEMDGVQHFENIFGDLDIIKENDEYKNNLVKDHDGIIIRIDCSYKYKNKRCNYIKEKIINSELSKVFDFSNVDFDYCDLLSSSSCLELCIKYWNEGIRELSELSNLIGMHKDVISRDLKYCADKNLISESSEEVHRILRKNGVEIAKIKQKKIKNSKGKPVMCIETQEVFRNPNIVLEKYPSMKKKIYSTLQNQTPTIHNINGELLSFKYIDEDTYQNLYSKQEGVA